MINHDALMCIIDNHRSCAIMLNHVVIWVWFGCECGKMVNI